MCLCFHHSLKILNQMSKQNQDRTVYISLCNNITKRYGYLDMQNLELVARNAPFSFFLAPFSSTLYSGNLSNININSGTLVCAWASR